VRNHQACNFMKQMQVADLCFFYHSNQGREIVGIVEVSQTFQPDPTDDTGRFGLVWVRARQALAIPVTLAQIKATPALAAMALVRQARLSVMPVTDPEWHIICAMGGLPSGS
jgi:predicted RNA-binding protein with PUA-like domain